MRPVRVGRRQDAPSDASERAEVGRPAGDCIGDLGGVRLVQERRDRLPRGARRGVSRQRPSEGLRRHAFSADTPTWFAAMRTASGVPALDGRGFMMLTSVTITPSYTHIVNWADPC